MNYEQKYKEALSRARVVNPGTKDYNIVTTIFPELKESEDERIRENAIQIIRYSMNGTDVALPLNIYKECINWLEKQSTLQVRTGLEWINTVDDACDKRYSEEYAHGEYCHKQSFKWGFQEGVDWFEEQGEQKLVKELKQEQKEQIINKACEWLKENIYNRVYKCNDGLGFPTAAFLEEFKKAMEDK